MKKFVIVFLIFLNCIALADVMPYYINSLRRNGIGFTSIQSPLVMRRTPSNDGEILETLNFDFKGQANCLINKSRCSVDEIFAAYSEKNKIALLTTIDESENWSLVCFNQTQNPVCGWVDEKVNKYYNWTDFFNMYGKKYGLYLFKDLQKADKVLFGAPMKQTNTTGSIEMPKKIIPWLVRGNWVLVKVVDFGAQNKTGWLNYRDDRGKLKLFVKFD
ncbi:MAG: hypothetical protein IJ877_00100 [Candidatus Gastranaerophilales bacterium]|nr:hypothetical protein [Candidatus Gastranaerophilales bacterium]